MKTTDNEVFLFVVDTDDYAGNFEREMCAYITGRIGECGVGEKIAEKALDEMPKKLRDWCDLNISSEPDDNGCRRPCYISQTPGPYVEGQALPFNSVEIYLDKLPPADIYKLMVKRAKWFCENNMKLDRRMLGSKIPYKGCRLVKKVVKTSYEEVDLTP